MDSSETRSPTVTQRDQWMVESQVFQIYELLSSVPRNAQSVMLELQRDKHIEFLTKGLRQLGPSFCVLDANRPWLCYWILHSIALLGDSVDAELENNTIDFLSRCQGPNGGYGGGPGQMPHLATTYAAINSLITLGGHRSLSSINRGKVYTFLQRMKDPSGAFRILIQVLFFCGLGGLYLLWAWGRLFIDTSANVMFIASYSNWMHDAGEMDVRACYTAISVASVLNILDDELVKDVGNYILRCQTYEGGISGEPGSEAHGGYTFCGLATMVLIGEVKRLDLTSLIDWVVFRQGVECGFQGRTNKLVDGCYSFWQGGVFALIQKLHSIIEEQLMLLDAGDSATDGPQIASTSCHSGQKGPHDTSSPAKFSNIGFDFLQEPAEMEPLFHSIALQQYILLCSQLQDGGFRDKPGKHRDYYHTCYCLSGLSVAQYSNSKDADSPPLPRAVFGPYSNLLEPIHPLYNVILDRYHEAYEFFSTS